MSYHIQKTLPTAAEVIRQLPLPDEIAHQVGRDRAEICDILSGKDPRKLLIIGPCSAWPSESVVEYAKALKPIADQVSDQLKVVMRVYLQKPRTKLGWLGALNQPDPYSPPDMETGIMLCREMMLRVLQAGLPVADEAVFTHNDGYFVDLLSWIAIGARSTEDQEHRIFSSMIPHPVGLKNPTSGNIRVAVNSVLVAQHENVFALHGNQVKTSGNPYAHLVLRGGRRESNYHLERLQKATKLLQDNGAKNPAIIIDTSHENSINKDGQKDPLRQPDVAFEVLESLNQDPEVAKVVKGFMVESFIHDGKQNLSDFDDADQLKAGVSVTDGCLGMEKTKDFILELAEKLKS